ncbi:MAG: hypothetical protein OEY61_08255 [Gammaproteobacteria bacterium]|nr:hypothetical protein [Gammaproteobacteria bacterium]
MQPAVIALLVTLLPAIAANLAYLMSATAGYVPWCLPYIDGCTTISQAARHGNALFIFRAIMMFYAILLIWYWWIVKLWLNSLDRQATRIALIISWLGIIAALFLVIYVDYLGSSGTVYRLMRRYGVIIYFSLTPLAHMLMINHLRKLKITKPDTPITLNILTYQTLIVILILIMGITHVVMSYTGLRSYESENIIEWNYSLLLTLFFASSIYMWKDLNLKLMLNK